MNRHLVRFDSDIVNCRVTSSQIQQYKTDISYTVFLRYFISDFVKEERVIYMDCDMVVTGPLDDLFTMDLKGYPRRSSPRLWGDVSFTTEKSSMQGFLVIDNDLLDEPNK